MYTEKKERNVREQWIFRTVFFLLLAKREKKRKRESERDAGSAGEFFMFIMFFSTYNGGNKMQTWERTESEGAREQFSKIFFLNDDDYGDIAQVYKFYSI